MLFALASLAGCGDSNDGPAGLPVDTRPPAIPDGISGWAAVGGLDQVQLQWEANVTDADLVGYMVYRSERVDGGFRPLSAELVTTNSWIDTTVRPGMTYHYRISARDASDNESGPSQIFTVTVPEGGADDPSISDPASR
jgi:fibronectin type 3 domain-containing protein